MSKLNSHKNQNHNSKTRKENDPRYERVVVGHKLVPMQATHVDDIAVSEGREVMHGPRCSKCFLKNARAGHFCRWNIENEGPRDPAPRMRQVPIYCWVLRE
jgi:hypothetical protein